MYVWIYSSHDQPDPKTSRVLPPGILERGSSDATNQDQADEFTAMVALLGRPNKEDSTQYDSPRPPIVSRFIEYQPENIRIGFFPTGRMGDPPPYKAWKLLGYVDIATNAKISNTEATQRFKDRIAR